MQKSKQKKLARGAETQTAVQKASGKLQISGKSQDSGRTWFGTVWLPSLASCILLLAAYPPLIWYPLAWVAPIGWLFICDRKLPVGRRGYFHLWLGGCLFWLVSLHSIRLAFWVLHFGWVAMSMYLALYIPLFVAVTRVMVHRWHVPLVVAAPVAWTGFELIRAMFLTGYAATTLAHSQAWQPLAIQIADTIGHGGVSFLMMAFASAVFQLVQQAWARYTPRSDSVSLDSGDSAIPNHSASNVSSSSFMQLVGSAVLAMLIPTCMLIYGNWRIRQAEHELATKPALLNCLLLQENTPTIFEMNVDIEAFKERTETAWTKYAQLCQSAAKNHPQLDMVIWPESTFTAFDPHIDIEYQGTELPKWLQQELRTYNLSPTDFEERLQSNRKYFDHKVRIALLASRGLGPMDELPLQGGPSLLVGCDHMRYGRDRLQRHAGALWIGADGAVKGTYAKMHLVMFGEYIPLRPLLGWLESVFGFAGADPGDKPQAFLVNGIQVAPNICFETMVPRLIVWQIRQLKSQGTDPQLLINLTNDSWFKGTSMLDHHLASSIICCVENRRPMLVAANTGLTAEIDGCGRLMQCTERLTAEAVYAQPQADGRWGLVQSVGYPLSWLCAGITLWAAVAGAWSSRRVG